MRAMIVVSHPDPSSFNHALAHAVRAAWQAGGCTVALHDLHAEGFDPRLTIAEARGGASGDALVHGHIEELRAADLLAVVHPNCWGAPPAMMKGWIDRVFAPDAAYGFAKGVDHGDVPTGLLTIRGALVLNTGNTPAGREHAQFGDPLDQIWKRCVLQYCGIAEVRRRLFGVVATNTRQDRAAWLAEARVVAEDLLGGARAHESEGGNGT